MIVSLVEVGTLVVLHMGLASERVPVIMPPIALTMDAEK